MRTQGGVQDSRQSAVGRGHVGMDMLRRGMPTLVMEVAASVRMCCRHAKGCGGTRDGNGAGMATGLTVFF